MQHKNRHFSFFLLTSGLFIFQDAFFILTFLQMGDKIVKINT